MHLSVKKIGEIKACVPRASNIFQDLYLYFVSKVGQQGELGNILYNLIEGSYQDLLAYKYPKTELKNKLNKIKLYVS